MKNKILKILVLVVILFVLFTVGVGAQGVTHFVMNGAENNDKVSVNVETDCTTGVGGMDLILVYEKEAFELIESSVRCSLPSCELVVKENAIRVLWDTTDAVTLPNVLLSADFKSVNGTPIESGMYFSVNEYYDSTLELNDIPFEVKFASADKITKAKRSGMPVFITVFLVIIGVIVCLAAVYWLLANKKIEEIASNFAKNTNPLEAV